MTGEVAEELLSTKETVREQILMRRLGVPSSIGLLFATGLCLIVLTLVPSLELVLGGMYGSKGSYFPFLWSFHCSS